MASNLCFGVALPIRKQAEEVMVALGLPVSLQLDSDLLGYAFHDFALIKRVGPNRLAVALQSLAAVPMARLYHFPPEWGAGRIRGTDTAQVRKSSPYFPITCSMLSATALARMREPSALKWTLCGN